MDLDTFDNDLTDGVAVEMVSKGITTPKSASDDIWDQDDGDEEIASEQTSKKGNEDEGEEVDEDSQVALLENKEDKKEEGEEKDKKGTDGDKEETKEPAKLPDTPKAKEIEGKTVRAFRDGEQYEVPQDATIKVKVGGKNELVPVQELINNYAGKTHWDVKFSELNEEKKQYIAEKSQYEEERTEIIESLKHIREKALKSVSGEESPMEFVTELLDMMNIDAYDFNRNMKSYMFQELQQYAEMSEVEREAYWIKQKNEYLERKQETSTKQLSERKANQERIRQVDSLRQLHGVSEDQYVEAFNSLSSLGYENITPEQIVKYAAVAEPTRIAEELITPYLDQLSDDGAEELMISIAKQLHENKSLTPETVKRYLAEEFKVPELISSLNAKAGTSAKKAKVAAAQDERLETFDDLD